jgi:peptide/nickel transport system substrate-binding protein
MPRRMPVLLVALALVLATATGGVAQDERAERLTVAFNAFENNITPFTLTMQGLPNTHDLVHLVYDSLFWSQVKAEPDPWLATSAEPSDDYSTWTVQLRDDVVWHDGEPFTAADVAFSFEYYTANPAGRYAHHVFDIPEFQSAEVTDTHTVELTFAGPAPTFKILPGADLPIVPKHIWEGVDEAGTQTDDLPVGTGPFRLVDIQPDQQYRFEANEDYFLGAPSVSELVVPIVRDPSAVFAGLRSGELDSAVHGVPPELVEDFEAADDIELGRSTRMESVGMYLNTRKEITGDPVLRKAMALAIDRESIVQTVLLGNGEPGRDTFIHPQSPWAVPAGVAEHDPERARTLLQDAGYTLEGDTLTTPEGEPVEIEILVSSFAPQHIRAMQLVTEHVGEIGVTMTVETLDPASIGARRSAEPGEVPDNDGFVQAMESHAHADPDALIHFFGSPQPGRPGGSFSGYSNPDFDRLGNQAAEEADLDARRDLIHQMQETFAEEVPAIALYYPDGIYAYRPAAFDGWVEDPGHGLFTKRSFVSAAGAPAAEATGAAAPAETEAADESETVAAEAAGQAAGLPWAWIIVALLLVVIAVAVVARRNRAEPEED